MRWHALFEYRPLETLMAGIDSLGFIMMTMVMLALVVIITLLGVEHLLTAPGTQQPPQQLR
jgi:hypothetical protein